MAVRLDPLRNPVIREHAERIALESVLSMVAMQVAGKFGVAPEIVAARLAGLDPAGIRAVALRMLNVTAFEDVFPSDSASA